MKEHIVTVAWTTVTAKVVIDDTIVTETYECSIDEGLSNTAYQKYIETEYGVEVFKIISTDTAYGKMQITEDKIKKHGVFLGYCPKPKREKK